MKALSIVAKSIKEQLRSYWVLLLSLCMGPFFIFVYFLITESSEVQYRVLIQNNDSTIVASETSVNHGKELITYFYSMPLEIGAIPFTIKEVNSKEEGVSKLKDKDADALIIIPPSFSRTLELRKQSDSAQMSEVEFVGDLTSAGYLVSAVWANEVMNEFMLGATNNQRLVMVKETPLGISGTVGYFDMIVPGILIVSLIMLMFTASIAFVAEVENKTIMRLKLSKLTSIGFLAGNSFVQVCVGILSLLLTLLTAIGLGFNYQGSLAVMILIAGLTSLSIIAFSLIIAGITKTTNEVLVVGNFPMFLFMFFTGAAFPLKSAPWFSIAGYPVNLQGLMSPTHAISALNKTLVMDMRITSIFPEIIAILVLTIIYFIIGGLIFKFRHLRVRN